ncbi:DUF262 domain-containing protein [Bradyrhizobium sp. 188]|uniref:DUF262 domain-containing protein n=1 Tax=Bradyrhizobium sp. 188 TaxID=2782656 RepID=UPI001FF8FC94|nr:DUF262 domain-containing protein [Bradyrhizobium sp. 188]MCK1496084.1 DUF262 domain-containing protein [Bradyrhizobium sp. 188]
MSPPSFYSDPHVQFLSQLLEEIGAGHLQIPRFQRPMVWNWETRRELLRSIRDGIPIGAVMVWRTSRNVVKCYEFLGPHRIAPPPEGATRQYLLDGVQRLSTLYGALHLAPPDASLATDKDEGLLETPDGEEDDAVQNFDVYFDLNTKDFYAPSNDEIRPEMLPLHLVLDSVALLRFQRKLAGHFSDQAIQASDEIARSFRDYKIPIIPITTDDLDMATRTFQSINSQGARMSETHMVHALTWSPDFDLQDQISEMKREVLSARRWAELNDDPILKACKAAFGLDVYKTNAQELSPRLKSEPEVLRAVGEALGRAADFLWDACGVPSPELMPYALQTVVLAEAFRCEPCPDARLTELLFAWFWMTTYGELFAGMSGDRVQVAISDMHEMIRTKEPVWTWKRPFEERPISRTFDFRAARAKAFAFRLAAIQDKIGPRMGSEILADAGRRSIVQIIPYTRLKGARNAFSSAGNRFLVLPAEAGSLRDAILSRNVTDLVREKHVISDAALTAIHNGDLPGFISQRLADIVELELRFLRPLVEQFTVARI